MSADAPGALDPNFHDSTSPSIPSEPGCAAGNEGCEPVDAPVDAERKHHSLERSGKRSRRSDRSTRNSEPETLWARLLIRYETPQARRELTTWGSCAVAAVLVLGGIWFSSSKSTAPGDLRDDELISQLSDLGDEKTKDSATEPARVAPPGLIEHDHNSTGPALEGPSFGLHPLNSDHHPADEGIATVGASGSNATNRQAIHFSPAEDAASRRRIQPAEYVPAKSATPVKPAAWLAGTIEDDQDATSQSNSHDRSGPRTR